MSELLQANPVSPPDWDIDADSWLRRVVPHSDPPRPYERGRHGGNDLQGMFCIACADGIVRRRNYGSAYGLQIQIDFVASDGHLFEATYSHLDRLLIKSGGARVRAGQHLGVVGNSGRTDGGKHLHFELHRKPGHWRSDFDPRPHILAIQGGAMALLSDDEQRKLKALLEKLDEANPPSNVGFVLPTIELVREFSVVDARKVKAHLATHPGGGLTAEQQTLLEWVKRAHDAGQT